MWDLVFDLVLILILTKSWVPKRFVTAVYKRLMSTDHIPSKRKAQQLLQDNVIVPLDALASPLDVKQNETPQETEAVVSMSNLEEQVSGCNKATETAMSESMIRPE